MAENCFRFKLYCRFKLREKSDHSFFTRWVFFILKCKFFVGLLSRTHKKTSNIFNCNSLFCEEQSKSNLLLAWHISEISLFSQSICYCLAASGDLPQRVLIQAGSGISESDINDSFFGSYTLEDNGSADGGKVYQSLGGDWYLYHFGNGNEHPHWVISQTVNSPGDQYYGSYYTAESPSSPLLHWKYYDLTDPTNMYAFPGIAVTAEEG